MSVRNTVLTLLKRHKMNQFTLSELRERCKDAIRSKSPTHFNSLTYKALWMMEKKGLLSVVQKNPEGEKVFSLTEQGFQLLETINLVDKSSASKKGSESGSSAQNLSRLVSDYSVALVEATAEAQEYQDLSMKLPELRQFLQNKFIEAKTRAAQLRGRLIATENALSECSDEPSPMGS